MDRTVEIEARSRESGTPLIGAAERPPVQRGVIERTEPLVDAEDGAAVDRAAGAWGSKIALVLSERPVLGGRLVDIASDMLAFALQVPRVSAEIDVPQLHRQTVEAMERFRTQAREVAAEEDVVRASYVLCSMIDEAILNTEWGEQSIWSQRSLLRLFHQETWGGERVFRYIETALDEPRHQQPFLEIAYCVLALGFEGKYRVDPKGKFKLEQLRDDVYGALGPARDRCPVELMNPVEPAPVAGERQYGFALLWIVGVVLLIATTAVFHQARLSLSGMGGRAIASLNQQLPSVPSVPLMKPSSSVVDRLRQMLAPEIERNLIHIEMIDGRISIEISTEALFEAGRADIAPVFFPVLDKLGKALEAIPGQILVVGHTDGRAIQTARFPSNWHLSLTRASEVVKYMSTVASLRGRLLPEGRGASEPLASNDTASGRARNRRVTIEILPDASLENGSHYSSAGDRHVTPGASEAAAGREGR